MGKQVHDNYVKDMLEKIAGDQFITKRLDTKVDYEGQISAYIDGVITNCCAIEIESRTNKQIRGALIDLLNHKLPKKLLILVPANIYKPPASVPHCEFILEKYKNSKLIKIKVILLKGTGNNPNKEDIDIIKKGLKDLDCLFI